MSDQELSWLALEAECAAEARAYGRQRLQERLQALADQTGALCLSSGEPLQQARFRNLPLLTTLGLVNLRARYGYRPAAQAWGFAVQERWGLAPRQQISPHLQQCLSYTATECGSFQKAQAMARRWGVNISATAIHKQVQILGLEAQRQEQLRVAKALNPATRSLVAQAAQAQAPNARADFSLVISIDAWKARDRGPDWGRKPASAAGARVEWHEVKVGVIYRLDQVVEKEPPHPDDRPRRLILEKAWVATPTGTEPHKFGRRLYAEALRRGLAQAKYVLIVADGAVWIWNIVKDRFEFALQELDFWHGSQHLWAVANDLYPDPSQAKNWVEPLLHQLRHGREAQVLQTLEALPAQAGKLQRALSELVRREIEYFQKHRDHLHYQDNAAKGLPVGSGVVESTCSQFQDRFKRTGQFWKSPSMGRLMALKVACQNGDWEQLSPQNAIPADHSPLTPAPAFDSPAQAAAVGQPRRPRGLPAPSQPSLAPPRSRRLAQATAPNTPPANASPNGRP